MTDPDDIDLDADREEAQRLARTLTPDQLKLRRARFAQQAARVEFQHARRRRA